MRIELQPAYILHSRPFRDTSLILDCLTQDYGRLSLIAKGARSPKSRQRQLCQPFSPLLLSWQGKSNLKTMIAIESRQLPWNLQKEHLFSGFYLNELLTRVIPEQDACSEVYQRYEITLGQMSRQEPLEPALRSFELGLLQELGYKVDLSCDSHGLPLRPESYYFWQDEQGWIPSTAISTTGISKTGVSTTGVSTAEAFTTEVSTAMAPRTKASGNAFLGAHLLALAEDDFSCADALRSAKMLSRLLFKPLLGSKPLASRKLFQKTAVANSVKEAPE